MRKKDLTPQKSSPNLFFSDNSKERKRKKKNEKFELNSPATHLYKRRKKIKLKTTEKKKGSEICAH